MKGIDLTAVSDDGNPGTFNAFRYGGIMCGIFTLLADLLKGCLPVTACRSYLGSGCLLFAFVMAAPVFGHAFSVFLSRRGRKGYRRVIRRAPRTSAKRIPTAGACRLLPLFFTGNSSDTACQKKRLCFSRIDLFLYSVRKAAFCPLGCIMLAGTVIYKHCIPLIYHDTRTDV